MVSEQRGGDRDRRPNTSNFRSRGGFSGRPGAGGRVGALRGRGFRGGHQPVNG